MNYIDFSDEAVFKDYLSFIDELEPNETNVEQRKEMGVHLLGESPEKLLNTLRPNEHPDILKYRLETYEPITKSDGKRILNALSKVQKQSSFSVDFESQEENSLYSYVNDYPAYGTLQKWVFDAALEYSLVDPNAYAVVFPIELPKTDTSFYKPIVKIFGSEMIIDEGYNYITIKLEEKNIVKIDNQIKEYDVYLLVTEKEITKITQIKENEYKTEVLHKYSFDRLPAFKLGGDVVGGSYPIEYESFISGILPYWNKAVRMDSDLDASYTLHMYPERVEIEVECKAEGCSFNDNGRHVRYIDDKEIVCHECKGSGWVTGRTPYGITQVKKEDALEQDNTIFPGVHYIEKDTSIVKLVEEKVDKLITKGFAAINLDVLDKSGENQSGVAKVIDRDAMNSFFVKVSNNLFDNIYKNSLELISLWRYGKVEEFDITKPVNFDYTSIESITEDIKQLRESKASSGLIAQKEADLINKSFFGVKNYISKDIIMLDPFYGKTEEDKANMMLTSGVSKIDYIISSNIYSFVQRAYSENDKFNELDRIKKLEKLKEYANELKQETETTPQIEVQEDGQGG